MEHEAPTVNQALRARVIFMHPIKVVVAAVALLGAVSAQQTNSVYASLAVNQEVQGVLGQGPTQSTYYTNSSVTFSIRGLPFQFIALLTGQYAPGSFVHDDDLEVDIALDGNLGVLVNGFTSLNFDHATDVAGRRDTTVVFPGEIYSGDVNGVMQAIVGNPSAPLGYTSSGAVLMRLRSGFRELSLEDDEAVEIPFIDGFGFEFYGQTYTSVWVSANGYLAFGDPRPESYPNETEFLSGPPRIAAFYVDLDPSAGDGATRIHTSQHKVGEDWEFVVSWEGVPEFLDPLKRHDFSLTLSQNGTIRIDFAGTNPPPWVTSIVGISPGEVAGTLSGSGSSASTDFTPLLGSFALQNHMAPIFEVFLQGSLINNSFFDLAGTSLFFFPEISTGSTEQYHVN